MSKRHKITDVKVQLYYPSCGALHIDEGWYAVNPHKRHLCFKCGKKFLAIKPLIGLVTAINSWNNFKRGTEITGYF